MELLTSTAQANKLIAAGEAEGFKPILTNNVPLTEGTHIVTATGVHIRRMIVAKDGQKYQLIESQFQTEKGEKFYAAINDTSLIDELQSGMKVTVTAEMGKPNAKGNRYMQASYKAIAVPAVAQ